jgi:glycosyltransferase involved in cell wall biosynthesis
LHILLTNAMETTSGGGINKTIREVGTNLVRQGHEVTVLQTNPMNLPNEEICSGFKIIRIKSRLGEFIHNLSPEMYLYLKASFKRLSPDVVHMHDYGTLLTSELMFFLRREKCPVVLSPHYGPESHDTYSGKYLWNIYNKLIGRHSFEFADKIICASQFEGECIQRAFGVKNDKIAIIPHGIDPVQTLGADTSNNERISLLYYGWLIELKGVQHILTALGELERKFHRDAQLSIIGQGRYESTLVQLANELGIESSISWYPFLFGEELYKKIRKADMSLLISRSENFGIQVAEVLAMGIPCIVAKTTALVEFLDEPGCFGIDYPPNSTELAELIINIKDRNPKVGPLSDRIRTWDKVVDDYERVYVSLLSASE